MLSLENYLIVQDEDWVSKFITQSMFVAYACVIVKNALHT